MKTFLNLRPIVRSYVTGVVAVGAIVLIHSVHSLAAQAISSEWLLLAGLTVLTGSFSVKVPSLNAYISVSEAFVFASVLMFGAEAGTITVLLECVVILLWMAPQGRPLYRMFFNMAAPAVAIWTAGHAFYLLSGIEPYGQAFTPLSRLFLPLLGFTSAYFVLNSWLVAVAVGLETRRSALEIWWNNFAWLSVNYFSGASVAALMVTYTERLDLSTLAVIVPLLLVSYLTFRTAMGRAEDSYNHLSELNRLYLSTIETLAMAIDAKDQITHGHIRRVQSYAVGLAKHVGVTDTALVKAIEAAALLHDMGKLAVPEHILNKPGKLTPAEFEKMKLHAGVGADILSAIDFPYPVVPIVRHHHESWNGSGYPDGLKGTDIPIGARILSVVDCFDALTSDRPYRPKLTDREALDILVERRGSMYDPLVVDTFLRVYREIAPDQSAPLPSTDTLTGIASVEPHAASTASDSPRSTDSRDPSDLSLAAIRATSTPISEVMEVHVRSLLPCSLAVLYVYDGERDELAVQASAPVLGELMSGWTVRLGERLSGWVAANRRLIINSDPALDSIDGHSLLGLSLSSTLSVPICGPRDLIGVLSLYAASPFSDHQAAVAEHVSSALADRLASETTSRASVAADREQTPRRQDENGVVAPVTSLIYIDIVNGKAAASRCGSDAFHGNRANLSARLRQLIGANDLLIRSRENEFVILVSRADVTEVRRLARQIRSAADELNEFLHGDARLSVAVDTVIAPADSPSVREVISLERSSAMPALSPAESWSKGVH